jgi:histidinol-phosphate/aromatic aminotransferase/cobyric acid decarboxylase-like protein
VLREAVAHRAGTHPEHVLVTSGSQQALDLVARTLLDPGDVAVVADPAYIGALQALRAAGAHLHGVASDAHGLRVDLLADALHAGLRPTLVHVVASFDNPTGATLDGRRRVALAELAEEFGFWIVDDDPYGELRWQGTAPTPLRDLTDRVITLGSTSKVLSPGLRVGWTIAPPSLHASLAIVKQATDLHTSTLSQHIAARLLGDHDAMAAHLVALRTTYRRRAGALADALERHLGGALTFARPSGGMFLWAHLDPTVRPGATHAGAARRGPRPRRRLRARAGVQHLGSDGARALAAPVVRVRLLGRARRGSPAAGGGPGEGLTRPEAAGTSSTTGTTGFMHETRWLWAIHVVHHSSEHYNLSTALGSRGRRRSPRRCSCPTAAAAAGLPAVDDRDPAGGQPALPVLDPHRGDPACSGRSSSCSTPPSHHRVHHGANRQYLDRNHGGILIVWDRLFGTLRARGREPVVYGLTENIDTFNPLRIATHEYADIVRDVTASTTWKDRLSFVFRGPGWAYERHRQGAGAPHPTAEVAAPGRPEGAAQEAAPVG